MWQTGYLTISKVENVFDNIVYHLSIPNFEVRKSLLSSVAEFMTKNQNAVKDLNNALKAFHYKDLASLEVTFKSLFASIPYNLFTNNKMYEYEGYYVSVFYAYLKAMGIDIVAEDITNKGRIDLTILMPEAIYVCEFKVDGSDALAQIQEKRYYEKYLDEKKDIYLVGIEFDTKERNISKFEYELQKESQV
jgi:hypothetical protein